MLRSQIARIEHIVSNIGSEVPAENYEAPNIKQVPMDNTNKAVEIFNKYAQAYQDKYMNLEHYHDSFDFFCQNIRKTGAQVLEVACGPGNITRYLLDKRPDFKMLSSDLAQNMLDLAKVNNPEATFIGLDGRKIGQLGQTFDAIMAGFFFPYLTPLEAGQFIQDAYTVLNPGGLLYISTMEESETDQSGLKKSSGGDEVYMYYHQAEALESALQAHGFTLLLRQRQDFPNPDGSNTIDLILIAQH